MCLFCKHAFEILRILRSNYFCCIRNCLGVCKFNHLLQTTPPGSVDSELLWFDDNLRCALLSICNASISDQSWLQATLPCSLGVLGLCEAFCASSAAFLGCCVSSSARCFQLLSTFLGDSFTVPLLICLLCFLVLLYQRYLPLSYLRPSGSFSFSLTFVSPISCCPLVHYVDLCHFFTRLRQCMSQGHSFSFLRAYHVQTGVCVFSLVLAWNSIVYFC